VGHAAEDVQHPAPDRVEVLVRDGQPRHGIEVADRHLRRHAPRPLVHGLGQALLGLELVSDLAHDLLQEVLQREQARRAPVLVDDDGHPELLRLELAQKRVGPL
jgi:hypothetical protein